MGRNSHHRGADSGPGQRQLRVGEIIRRALSEVLARADVHDPELNAMSITVSEVRISPDLKSATAFVMPLGGAGREAALAALRRNKGALRHHVSRGLALKATPDLRFVLDESFDRMDEMRRLFANETVQRDIAAPDADDAGDADDPEATDDRRLD